MNLIEIIGGDTIQVTKIVNNCPVRAAMDEITGGNMYTGEDEISDKIITVGGKEKIVCDEVNFYIMSRKMRLARFKLSRPNDTKCAEFYEEEFAQYNRIRTYNDLANYIRSQIRSYTSIMLCKIIELIDYLQECICKKILSNISAGKDINVSLPELNISTKNLTNNLMNECNIIIDFTNKLNINSITKSPHQEKIEHILEPEKYDIDLNTVIINITDKKIKHLNAGQIITHMEELLKYETIVGKYLCDCETYERRIINKLNVVYTQLYEILENL